jgi:CheY-like chemotaxis protein
VKSVLVLDDDLLVLRYIRAVLEPLGVRMVAANNVAAAYGSFIRHGGCDLLVVDVSPRNSSGAETISRLRRENPELPVVIMSATSPAAWRNGDAAQIGRLPAETVSYLWKPFYPGALRSAVKKILR